MFGDQAVPKQENRARRSRLTVTREFRALVRRLLAGLGSNLIFWRLTQYLMFPGRRDKDGNIIIDQTTLAEICKQPLIDSEGNYFSGVAVLQAYKRRVLPSLEWSDYSYYEKRARLVTNLEWPEGIDEALAKEKMMLANTTGAVYFDTGQTFNRQRKAEHRELDRKEALEHMAMAGCDEARRLLQYVNNLPPHRFEKMLTHLATAEDKARKIDNALVRERQLDILKSIAIQPQPYYIPSDRTVRIFSYNESVLHLKRNLRGALTKDFIGLDLRSAQLAVAARIWNIPSVTTLLKDKVKVWECLWLALDCPNDTCEEYLTDILKQAIYALVFGTE